jgi:murein DD-endopeptidase MepM/ murein hydrolase activator NlpD
MKIRNKIIIILVLATVTIGSILLLSKHIDHKKYENIKLTQSPGILLPEIEYNEYGIPKDSFNIIEKKIRWNQPLAVILKENRVPSAIINKIVDSVQGVFDIRKIRAGNTYKLFISKDTSCSVNHLVYEHTPVDYLHIDCNAPVKVAFCKRDIKTVTKTFTGVINKSLWETMVDKNANPQLAIALSEIYAWTVDFFRIAKGDRFKVIYEEEFVDTASIGIGKIHAAVFDHMGEEYYAIPFIQDSSLGYFDTTGNSLEREFLKAPLHFKYISSGFSYRRLHPVHKVWRPHYGIDYAAHYGTPVRAIGDGTVIHAGYGRGEGRWIKIRHNSVYTTGYLHLSRYGKGIKRGKRVKQGDIIGYVGSSGYSTGPHLDFRFWKNGHPVNPLSIKAPPVEPVHHKNLYAYDSVKSEVINRLSLLAYENDSIQQDPLQLQAKLTNKMLKKDKFSFNLVLNNIY